MKYLLVMLFLSYSTFSNSASDVSVKEYERVFENLKSQQSFDLELPMKWISSFSAPNDFSARAIADQLNENGYFFEGGSKNDSSISFRFSIIATQTPASLSELIIDFHTMAGNGNGEYDGWEVESVLPKIMYAFYYTSCNGDVIDPFTKNTQVVPEVLERELYGKEVTIEIITNPENGKVKFVKLLSGDEGIFNNLSEYIKTKVFMDTDEACFKNTVKVMTFDEILSEG